GDRPVGAGGRRVLRVRRHLAPHPGRHELVPAVARRHRAGAGARHRLRPGARVAVHPVVVRRRPGRRGRRARAAEGLARGTLRSDIRGFPDGRGPVRLVHWVSSGNQRWARIVQYVKGSAWNLSGRLVMLVRIIGAIVVMWIAFMLIGWIFAAFKWLL